MESEVLFGRTSDDELKLDEVVRSTAKIATQWEPVYRARGEVEPITGTKFGGSPYAEFGDVWPHFRERPYDFLVQFDFRDSPNPPVTTYQLITVFISWHALESDEVLESACLVRSYRDPSDFKAVPLLKPRAVERNDYQVTPCATRSCRVTTFPSPVGTYLRVPAIAAMATRFRGFRMVYEKSLKRLGYDWRNARTRVGGYPTWVHDNTLEDDNLVFIAQIAREHRASFCVGDAAPVFISARRDDPTVFEADLWQSH